MSPPIGTVDIPLELEPGGTAPDASTDGVLMRASGRKESALVMPPAGFEPATFGLAVPPQRAGYVDLQQISDDAAG